MEEKIVVEGRLCDVSGVKKGQVKISNGLIEAVGENLGTATHSFDDSCIIFPGFVDLHVHSREDGSGEWSYKEDFRTMSEAAINGGVVAVLDHPNTPEPAVTKERLLRKSELAAKSLVDVFLYGGIGPGTHPIEGQLMYKAFTAKSVADLYFEDFRTLERKLEEYRGMTVSFHCEDPRIVNDFPERPPLAEVSAIYHVLDIIVKYGLRGNICHVSTKKGMKLIEEAKRSGVRVTCEVTPHHLYFDSENTPATNIEKLSMRGFLTMNPPLRSRRERDYLLSALECGVVDFLATDHAPHTLDDKKNGARGVPHLDTYGGFVGVLIGAGVPLQRIVEITSRNAGIFLGEKYGLLEPGAVGSLTVLNAGKEGYASNRNVKSKCGWTPFDGVYLPATVEATIVRGKVYKH